MIFIAVARLDEAFALIDVGAQAAQRDGISARIRVWSMLRCRALFSAGQLADARAEAEAAIDMTDEIGDGSYGYINHVSLYILSSVALHKGIRPSSPRPADQQPGSHQAQECPSSRRLGAWLLALVADVDGDADTAARAALLALDPLAGGPLPATSPQMYADFAALTSILLEAGRHADAEAVVVRLQEFAALHPDFPLLECTVLHARALLDGDVDTALRAVALSSADPRPLVRARYSRTPGGCSRMCGRPRRCRSSKRRWRSTRQLAQNGTLPEYAACCAPAGSARRRADPARLRNGPN